MARSSLLLLTISLASCSVGIAAEPPSENDSYFRKQVEPILKSQCYQCHSHDGKKSRGGLVVDRRSSLLAGGDSGPAIVPGKPLESLLIKAIRHDGELKMPPKSKLDDKQIATLEEWVKRGAPWPESAAAGKATRNSGGFTEEDRRWWAFQPIRAVEPPKVRDPRWSKNPIDRFVFARLDAASIAPAAPADRAVLARRLTFDLTGLPPTPEELSAFLQDDSADAVERLVDRLLDSPRYGERWGRMWMELVRYAESDGYRVDDYRPNAWQYRDYVIRSLNTDKPYDQFVREQLAGDEIDPDNPEALVGSGYLWLGMYEYNNRDVRTQWDTILNDITDTTADAFLGLGYGCARCHDHKFDPILQKDYFRLRAFFAGLVPGNELPVATKDDRAKHQEQLKVWEELSAPIRAKIAALEEPLRKTAEREAIEKFPPDIQAMIRKPRVERTPLEHQLATLAYRQVDYEFDRIDKKFKEPQKGQYVALRKELDAFKPSRPKPLPSLMIGCEVGPLAGPTYLPKKSSQSPIEPGFLTLLDPEAAPVSPLAASSGRRTALANWLTRPDNPLTARVIVNRIWQQHFGRGLATNTSDFGRLGEPPSHPELLDWLAVEFVRNGWKLKTLHRWILTSQTYRQSSRPADPATLSLDPENRMLARMPVRRVEAEVVRDTILAVTGKLNAKSSGPAVDGAQPSRTVFTRSMRNFREHLLEIFDLPDNYSSVAERNVTTTPTQALFLFNSPAMQHHAQAFAERLFVDEPSDVDSRIDQAWRLAFGRTASDEERQFAKEFLAKRSKVARPVAIGDLAATELQFGKIPGHDGRALLVPVNGPPRLKVPDNPKLPTGDMTIEAFIVLRSIYEDGTVRLIASHGTEKSGGWSLGVTGQKSAYRPQTLVLQLWGTGPDGKTVKEPVFSGISIELHRPYFVAASLKLARDGVPGQVSFYVKDIGNDDEPLHTSLRETKLTQLRNDQRGPLCIAAADEGSKLRCWDGLVDDVRLSKGVSTVDQLALGKDSPGERLVGRWRFEASGAMRDDSSNRLDLILGRSPGANVKRPSDAVMAWADLCHVLLNANEFLYID